MITILHGDNQLASRKALDEIRSSYETVSVFDGKSIDPAELTQNLSAQSIFAERRLLVLENFIASKKELDLGGLSVDLVLWENKSVSPTGLKAFSGAKSLEFKIDTLVFRFCDALGLKNKKIAYDLFRQCLINDEVEFIFSMIIRQFRLMLCPAMANDWQRGKVTNQGQLIGTARLKLAYARLLEIDFKNKTGQLVGGLEKELEMFLLWI